MKILVAIKRALDYSSRLRLTTDRKNVDLTGAKLSMNPFCEIALEAAVQLKQSKTSSPTEVVAVSCGPVNL